MKTIEEVAKEIVEATAEFMNKEIKKHPEFDPYKLTKLIVNKYLKVQS